MDLCRDLNATNGKNSVAIAPAVTKAGQHHR